MNEVEAETKRRINYLNTINPDKNDGINYIFFSLTLFSCDVTKRGAYFTVWIKVKPNTLCVPTILPVRIGCIWVNTAQNGLRGIVEHQTHAKIGASEIKSVFLANKIKNNTASEGANSKTKHGAQLTGIVIR